jgi:NAD(P)-dependent dehydrogenase (short-subunit alcohol dehydrogenase family)
MNIKKLLDLSGRVAIITGGSVGLGRQMAEGLAEMGANLVLCARKKERCERAAEELKQLGVKTLALGCDVKNPNHVQAVVEATVSQFGRIDILINNAGTSWGAPVEEMRLEHWNKVIETNLTGTFYSCRDVARLMVEQKSGNIINIASVAGVKGPPGLAAYAASKGGVIALTRVLAMENTRHNIRVNAIAPGYFRTDMNAAALDDPVMGPKIVGRIPMRRVGRPEEIGPLAVYLASDQASFVTGEVYFISGGEMAQ